MSQNKRGNRSFISGGRSWGQDVRLVFCEFGHCRDVSSGQFWIEGKMIQACNYHRDHGNSKDKDTA